MFCMSGLVMISWESEHVTMYSVIFKIEMFLTEVFYYFT